MKLIRTILFSILLGSVCLVSAGQTKNRVIVLTDIENEPDDAMSMVRFLTYSNQWDVEGLVATTSVHQQNKIAKWRIMEILDAYEKVQPNLLKHESGYPSADYFRSITKEGYPTYGMNAVGEGKDSDGSNLIVTSLLNDDPRPLWVLVWGGPNCLAQALWHIKNYGTLADLEKAEAKLRVYTVSDQDDSGPWIRKNFQNVFYIVSPGFDTLGAYHHATWSGISGDKFHARCDGADFEIVSNPWLDEHIRSKGPLGAQYPQVTFLMEGDTPTFMYLIENGLGSSEHPNWGSWGGRYEYYTPRFESWFAEAETRPIWTDATDEVLGVDGAWHTGNHETIWRWRQAYQNDFEARMDWTIKPYKVCNHAPVLKGDKVVYINAKKGETVKLTAPECSDPDGNAISYKWYYYPGCGSFTVSSGFTATPVKIANDTSANAEFQVPVYAGRTGDMHIILEVTDSGKPALTRYMRYIVNVAE